MDLAKDLAWQRIFSGCSTNLKTEKLGFFLLHSPFILSHFPIIREHEITTENIDIKWALNR